MNGQPTDPTETVSGASNRAPEDGHAQPTEEIFDQVAEATNLTAQAQFTLSEALLGGGAVMLEVLFEQPGTPAETPEQRPSVFASKSYAAEPHFKEPGV